MFIVSIFMDTPIQVSFALYLRQSFNCEVSVAQSSPGSIHKRRPRMKVTPIIPSSLCKPKLSAGDTYVFSETESHFIDLTKFSSKLLSAKNKKNTSSPSHRPSTPLSTDPNQICSGKSEEGEKTILVLPTNFTSWVPL